MRKFRPRRPSPALIVASVALFVAMGGGAYAAFSLPKNSVGSKQIKNGAVGNSKLGNNSVGTAKLRNGSITSSKLNTAGLSVPNASFATSAGSATTATTATAATTATTATSANALNGVQYVAGPSMSLDTNETTSQTVTCPGTTVPIGGNEINDALFVGFSANEVALGDPSPSDVTVWANNQTGSSVDWNAYAVCISGSVSGTTGTSVAHVAK